MSALDDAVEAAVAAATSAAASNVGAAAAAELADESRDQAVAIALGDQDAALAGLLSNDQTQTYAAAEAIVDPKIATSVAAAVDAEDISGQITSIVNSAATVAVAVQLATEDAQEAQIAAEVAQGLAEDAQAGAEAAQIAAEAVGDSNDTIIASRLNDDTSASYTALDGAAAALIDEPTSAVASSLSASLDQQVPPLVVDALAADDTPALAAAAAAETAVNDELDTSPRIPVPAEPHHGFKDTNDRYSAYALADAVWHFGKAIDTPGVGIANTLNLTGTYDPVTDRWAETTIDQYGRQVGLAAGLARLGVPTARLAGVALTTSPGINFAVTETGRHARYPFRVAPNVRRMRLHLRNYNERDLVSYNAVAVTGLWWGEAARDANGELTGAFASAPTQIGDAVSVGGSTETVTEWVDVGTVPGRTYLLSLAYTCPSQTNHYGIGGGWTSTAISEAGDISPATTLAEVTSMPLDVWTEVEVSAAVPVVAGLGDSLTAGTGSIRPAYDSWLALLAMSAGAIPQFYANHGSQLANWGDATQVKWTKYAGLDRPDALVIAAGSNDIAANAPLATVQSSFRSVAAVARSLASDRLHAATIMPRSLSATPEGVRASYNQWLATLPAGITQVWDFSSAVADPSSPAALLPAYDSGDGTHINTVGYAAAARSITQPLA